MSSLGYGLLTKTYSDDGQLHWNYTILTMGIKRHKIYNHGSGGNAQPLVGMKYMDAQKRD